MSEESKPEKQSEKKVKSVPACKEKFAKEIADAKAKQESEKK